MYYKMSKKLYNPFKMWGSYVGFFVFAIVRLLPNVPLLENFSTTNILFTLGNMAWMWVGFLLGWGIHSLFRRFKKC